MKKMILFLISMAAMQSQAAPSGRVEPILGYQPDAHGISFQVTSGGCTLQKDFKLVGQKRDDGIVEVTLLRLRADPCFPYLPMGERFTFDYKEIGLTPGENFTLTNPNGIVQAWIW